MSIKGFSWPLRSGSITVPEIVYDEDVIAASVKSILLTGNGERIMRPSLGSGVMDLMFENSGPVLATRIKRTIIDALKNNEPRITLTSVKTEIDDTFITTYIEYIWNNKQSSVSVSIPNNSLTSDS